MQISYTKLTKQDSVDLVKVKWIDYIRAEQVWMEFWSDYPPIPDFMDFMEPPNLHFKLNSDLGYHALMSQGSADRIHILLGEHAHTCLMAYRAQHRDEPEQWMECIYRVLGCLLPTKK